MSAIKHNPARIVLAALSVAVIALGVGASVAEAWR